MRTSHINKIYVFLFIILVIGIGCGIKLGDLIDTNKTVDSINYLINTKNIQINFIVNHLLIISLIFLISFFIISIPLNVIYIFYNGISIGFIIKIFTITLGIKGLFYSLFFIIITKSIFIIFLLILLKTLIKISILVFKYIITNEKDIINNNIKLFKKSLLCICIIILNDIFIFCCGSKLLNFFSFLT